MTYAVDIIEYATSDLLPVRHRRDAAWWFRVAVGAVVLSALVEAVTVRFAFEDNDGFLLILLSFAMNAVFAVAFIAATIFGGRAAIRQTLPAMDVWWWWGAPFSVTFTACHYFFQLQPFDVHFLALFVGAALVAIVSTFAWTLVAVCQVMLMRGMGRRRLAMVAFALLLLPILWGSAP